LLGLAQLQHPSQALTACCLAIRLVPRSLRQHHARGAKLGTALPHFVPRALLHVAQGFALHSF